MGGKGFTEADFIRAKREAKDIFRLTEKLSKFIFHEKKLPIAINFQVELLPWYIDKSTSLEQLGTWMEVLWMLKKEFGGEIKPAE